MLRHFVSIVRSGQLRFRLETYGLYYPATPDSQPYWKVSPGALLLLLRSAREYSSWVKTTSFLRVGAHEWWARQWPGVDVEGELSRQSAEEVERRPGVDVEGELYGESAEEVEQRPGVDMEGELSRQGDEEVRRIGCRSDPPSAAPPGEDVR